MPANKKQRKTTRGLCDISQFEAAFDQIVLHGKSIRQAAKMFQINQVTLNRYRKRRLENNYFPVKVGYARQNFYTTERESILTEYLKKYAEIYPGLCVRVVRKYASEFSQKIGLTAPKSWIENKMAGMDWYNNFMHRNKSLQAKIDRKTSKEKVRVFYDRLWRILCQFNFTSDSIYSLDEIGVNIEEFKDKIWLTTTKNGSLALQGSQIKFSYAANATGSLIPPLFLITLEQESKSDIKIKTEIDLNKPNDTTFINFLKNGIDLKTLPDWTEDPSFLVFLKHFTKNLKDPVGPKLLLLIENQAYHLSIECLEYCKENDVYLLVIPSFLSQNIEPLNSIVSQLKKTISSLYQNLVLQKAEQKKSIFNIPNMVSEGLLKCLDENSIKDGFKSAGIFPYNREVIING